MTSTGETHESLLGHVLVPVADEADADATARALAPYDPEHVTATHVVEKGGGVPDKTPVEQSEQVAEDAYAAIRRVFPEADDHTVYGADVVETIFEAADAVDATAVAFRSRGGNRLVQFLSGDRTLQLATEAPLPVIALPVDASADADSTDADSTDADAAVTGSDGNSDDPTTESADDDSTGPGGETA